MVGKEEVRRILARRRRLGGAATLVPRSTAHPPMTTSTRRALLIASLLAPLTWVPAVAADAPTAEALELGLAGRWSGALEYRDYQTGALQRLPVQTQIQRGADGATLTRLSAFDDGPQTGTVHTTTVSLFEAGGARVTHALFRKGRAPELWSEDTRVTAHGSTEQWTTVSSRRGQDGGQPADIRITQTRRGSELRAVKEVKAVGAPDSDWAFRNQTVLTRLP